jgi:3-methyl-2-oxobutanoate hydroxymethyltransferase
MPATPLSRKVTIGDLRAARRNGERVAMLTCYDYSTARLMQQAGVPALLVGDSAANVILGHPTTLPVSLEFMIEITAAVRRGAPLALVVADMPFGSYQGSVARGTRNVFRMVKQTGCDCVKLEAGPSQLPLIRELADAGVAVIAHLGLRPQSVAVVGGYRYQGRTAAEAHEVVALAQRMEAAGAVALLLEAVPAEVGRAVVEATQVPVIGCGAGPSCHGSVFVTHDAVGLSGDGPRPRFVPQLGDLATPALKCFGEYVDAVRSGRYPTAEHQYTMSDGEREKLLAELDGGRASAAAATPHPQPRRPAAAAR